MRTLSDACSAQGCPTKALLSVLRAKVGEGFPSSGRRKMHVLLRTQPERVGVPGGHRADKRPSERQGLKYLLF